MPSPEAIALRRQFASAPPMESLGLDQMRAMCETFGDLTAEPPSTSYLEVRAGDVPAEWAVPACDHGGRVLLYLHGGGFLMGSARMYRRLVGHLAHATAARVLSVDYRLAPEHPFPAGIEDATAALRWLVADGTPTRRIAVAGDSAGGSMALSVVQALHTAGEDLPAAVIAISPWADLSLSGETYVTRAEVDPFAAPDAGRASAEAYLAGADPTDPLASPVFADFTGFPPILIHVGDHEVILDDSRRIATRAAAAGVDVTLDVWDGMHHVFHLAAGRVPEADEAIRRIGAWTKSRLGTD